LVYFESSNAGSCEFPQEIWMIPSYAVQRQWLRVRLFRLYWGKPWGTELPVNCDPEQSRTFSSARCRDLGRVWPQSALPGLKTWTISRGMRVHGRDVFVNGQCPWSPGPHSQSFPSHRRESLDSAVSGCGTRNAVRKRVACWLQTDFGFVIVLHSFKKRWSVAAFGTLKAAQGWSLALSTFQVHG